MFKDFKLSDVFEKIDTPKIKAKANDFPTEYSDEYCVPLLTAGAENQGLNRYARRTDCPMIINNCISVSANGANSGICFFQPHDFAVLQDAYAVKVIGHDIQSIEEGLYLTGALNKAIRDNHDWVNKAGWNNVKDDSVELPVIENSNPDHEYTVDDIDWQYMRDRITELERDRITELDAYLRATGLNDYELTEEDKKILSLSAKRASDEDGTLEDNSEDEVRFGEFKIESLFHKVDLKRLKKTFEKDKDLSREQTSEYSLPLINAKNGDNGIMYYGRLEDWESDTYCIDIVNDGAISTGNVYPQPQRTGVLYNAYMIKPNANIQSEAILMYLSKSIEKIIKEQFGYDNKATWDKVKVKYIYLPIKSDGTPDFDYMERYIRAMEKIVIADVVKYKDKVIETTKAIVE